MGEKLEIKYVGDIYSEDILLISNVGMTARLKSKDEVIKILNGWIKSYSKLKDKIALTEKALELACEELSDMLIECTKSSLIDDFKTKAKVMMKSE